MPTFKNIRIKKRGGGTRLQRVQVLASGKYKFVKNKSSSSGKSKKSKSKSSKTPTKKRRSKGGKTTTKRKNSKRIPLSVITGGIVSVFAPPAPGWGSVKEKVEAGAIDQAFQSFVATWTGLRIGGIGGQAETEFPIAGLLNPFDMGVAPALKTTIYTKLATKIARKLGGNPFTRIPILKDWVSFS